MSRWRNSAQMAAVRTSQALDRTTLAWIRTTLTMKSFDLGMIAFFRTLRMQTETPATVHLHERAILVGESLVVIGIVVTILVALAHLRNLRRLHRGEVPPIPNWPLSVTVALLLAAIALGVSAYRALTDTPQQTI